MSDLKEILFHRTYVALNAYLDADKKLDEFKGIGPGLEALKRIHNDRYQRFSALWELIETAGLEGEYQSWKRERTNYNPVSPRAGTSPAPTCGAPWARGTESPQRGRSNSGPPIHKPNKRS